MPIARLKELVAQGKTVVIVSTSLNRPQGFIEVLSQMYKRGDSLEEVKKRYPQGGLFLYVSDNRGDDEVSRQRVSPTCVLRISGRATLNRVLTRAGFIMPDRVK